MSDLRAEFAAVIASADENEELSAIPMWRRLFEAAEDHLAETQPGEYEIEDIGRLARSWLRDTDVDDAWDTLTYAYWEAAQQEVTNKLRWMVAQAESFLRSGDAECLLRDALAEHGDDVTVDRHMLRRVLSELGRLQAKNTNGGA